MLFPAAPCHSCAGNSGDDILAQKVHKVHSQVWIDFTSALYTCRNRKCRKPPKYVYSHTMKDCETSLVSSMQSRSFSLKNQRALSKCFCTIEPTIEEFPSDTDAIEGEGVIFKMMVRGNQQPTLTWYHQGTQLTSDHSLEMQQDGGLFIASSELRHNGVYKLLAKNSRGSVEREVTLTVRQEEEEVANVDREGVEVRPVPVAEFGDYVADSHSNSNEIFKLQYVCSKYCT